MFQVQQEVSRLQSLVSDQLPQEKQRQQQRMQAVSQALTSPAAAEVPHAGLLNCFIPQNTPCAPIAQGSDHHTAAYMCRLPPAWREHQ